MSCLIFRNLPCRSHGEDHSDSVSIQADWGRIQHPLRLCKRPFKNSICLRVIRNFTRCGALNCWEPLYRCHCPRHFSPPHFDFTASVGIVQAKTNHPSGCQRDVSFNRPNREIFDLRQRPGGNVPPPPPTCGTGAGINLGPVDIHFVAIIATARYQRVA